MIYQESIIDLAVLPLEEICFCTAMEEQCSRTISILGVSQTDCGVP
jgi:hypothetical protein